MITSDEETIDIINVAVATSSFILLILVILITVFIYKYRNRFKKHVQEVNKLKISYQQELMKAQLEMQEQTFRTISQEIHDNAGQILSLARLLISNINLNDPVTTQAKIDNAKKLLDTAIEDLRDLARRLNTNYISQQPLSKSLELQLDLVKKTGLYTTHLETYGEEKGLDAKKKLIIFRIAQEAISNILKHGQAKNISIVLTYQPDKIDLSIRDDGKGFEVPSSFESEVPSMGIGIRNMYLRASLIGAQFNIQSQSDEGTVVKLSLPNIS